MSHFAVIVPVLLTVSRCLGRGIDAPDLNSVAFRGGGYNAPDLNTCYHPAMEVSSWRLQSA